MIKTSEQEHMYKSPKIKHRSELMRSLEESQIKTANLKLGERIAKKYKNIYNNFRSPAISLDKYEKDFQNHQYYRQFNKKFYLPKIEEMGYINY